jgi:hypothetical protein
LADFICRYLASYYDKVDLYHRNLGVKENLPHLPDSTLSAAEHTFAAAEVTLLKHAPEKWIGCSHLIAAGVTHRRTETTTSIAASCFGPVRSQPRAPADATFMQHSTQPTRHDLSAIDTGT